MKHLEEYRNAEHARKILDDIHKSVTKSWSIMEICGGQTHSLVRNGILGLLPSQLTMVHGPGCPVCVTSSALIETAIQISMLPNVVLCSFGDMLRVPGSHSSLLAAKARGADVRMVYSPMDAVQLAVKHAEKKVVFFAVGFETTAPANALAVLQAKKLGLRNFYMLSAQVLVPSAMRLLLDDGQSHIDGFLAAGHVCAVTGVLPYLALVDKYHIPIVVTGFEVLDLLLGILHCVKLLENCEHVLENRYSRVVKHEGNLHAIKLMDQVYEVRDREWRGIGLVPDSGLDLKMEYSIYDANLAFDVAMDIDEKANDCISGSILKGIKKPIECPCFGNQCTPQHPLGAPMVSSEGACAAYFNYV